MFQRKARKNFFTPTKKRFKALKTLKEKNSAAKKKIDENVSREKMKTKTMSFKT